MLSYFAPSSALNSGVITIENIMFYGNGVPGVNGIMTNTVPSGYTQIPQTILRDVKFSHLATAFNIRRRAGK